MCSSFYSRSRAQQHYTPGDKPCPFQLDNAGDWYYIGSEVGSYLQLYRGTLYKKFPALWRRLVTPDERKRLIDQGIMRTAGFGENSLPTNLTLVKAMEVDEILAGDDHKFRSASNLIMAQQQQQTVSFIGEDSCSSSKYSSAAKAMARRYAGSGSGGGVSNLPPLHPNQQLLDAIPSARGKRRVYPLCFDDLSPERVERNARQPEVLVPIRVELDIEGQKVRDFFTWNRNGREGEEAKNHNPSREPHKPRNVRRNNVRRTRPQRTGIRPGDRKQHPKTTRVVPGGKRPSSGITRRYKTQHPNWKHVTGRQVRMGRHKPSKLTRTIRKNTRRRTRTRKRIRELNRILNQKPNRVPPKKLRNLTVSENGGGGGGNPSSHS